MERNRLLIVAPDPTRYAELIKEFDFSSLELIVCNSIEKAKNRAKHCNMILGEPTRIVPILECAKRLQWIQ